MRNNKKYIGILLMASAILLTACSSDDTDVRTETTDNASVGREVQMVSYVSAFVETKQPRRAAPSSGFSAYTPERTTSMGVYMLLPDDWANPHEERITFNNKWHAYFDVSPDKTYTVYGYMPKTGEMGSTLVKTTDGAATLTITGIKPVVADDICIITGVKDADEGLAEGQFSWYWPIGDENYRIFLLLDHLYAAAQFSLRIDGEYAQLRTIKLKTMKISADKGSVNATVELTHNTTGTSPIASASYSAAVGSDDVVIYNSDEGTALDTTTPLLVNAYFAPTLSGNLTLVSTYDVYDSKGNLIRQNRTSANKLPNLEAVRGQRVLVNMLVNPTYLYVLSDPDLNSPTVTIGD